MVTMSQKSSILQPAKTVSKALTPDNLWLPGVLWAPPIDSVKQVSHLSGRDRHRAIGKAIETGHAPIFS